MPYSYYSYDSRDGSESGGDAEQGLAPAGENSLQIAVEQGANVESTAPGQTNVRPS